ncbi:MAG: sulfotransferase [Acidimicrobiales bacterium]
MTTEPTPVSHRPPADGPQRVLFIGGLGRSGSTLIEMLLNEIPWMVSAGETVHLWERGLRNDERCGCGEAFSDCSLWTAIGDAAFGGWDQVDVEAAIAARWREDRTRRMPLILARHRVGSPTDAQAAYLDLLRPVLQAAGRRRAGAGSVVLESSKHLSTGALLALDPALDVRILHLIRDPRGVAYSWTKSVSRPETDGELMPTYRPSRTALRWVSDNTGFELLARSVPTLRLRYEDFLDDPSGQLRRIVGFAGLPPDARIDLGFLEGTTAHLSRPMHSIAGNPMRFGSQDLELRADTGWRDGLDPSARRVVERITTPVRIRYHYRN